MPRRRPPGAIKPLPITVAKAEAREVQRSVETVGSLLAWDDAQVRTEQPGTIARLLVDLGDSVTRGQVLAEYDAREFELAVKQAEADLLSSQQSLAREPRPPSGPARPRSAAPRTAWFPSRPRWRAPSPRSSGRSPSSSGTERSSAGG